MCGENGIALLASLLTQGSPPRVRGKPVPFLVTFAVKGITPACAGKTDAISDYSIVLRDHPRVCGENISFHFSLQSARGSPPRVRGKLSDRSYSNWKPRITPACAGKTSRG